MTAHEIARQIATTLTESGLFRATVDHREGRRVHVLRDDGKDCGRIYVGDGGPRFEMTRCKDTAVMALQRAGTGLDKAVPASDPHAGIKASARRGDLYTRYSDEQIRIALAAGIITLDEVQNQDL